VLAPLAFAAVWTLLCKLGQGGHAGLLVLSPRRGSWVACRSMHLLVQTRSYLRARYPSSRCCLQLLSCTPGQHLEYDGVCLGVDVRASLVILLKHGRLSCLRAPLPTGLRVCSFLVVFGHAQNVQSELAAANSVADEVLSSMTTVKAHAAQDSALAAYANKLER